MSIGTIIAEISTAIVGYVRIRRRVAAKQAVARDLRRATCKIIHVKQVEKIERELADALAPLFEKQIKSIASRLREMDDTKSADDTATNLMKQVFDPKEWKDELVNRALPVLAHSMVIAAVDELMRLGIDVRKKSKFVGVKETTATEWLEEYGTDWNQLTEAVAGTGLDIGIMTEIPEWMKRNISEQLEKTFEQDYWDDINIATGTDVERVLEQGLEEGWSIRRMANEMSTSFAGDTIKYAKMRATRIARTESGNALNGARRGSMDQLIEELGPQVPMKPSWLSILGSTTRASHASLDGDSADEDGLWNLSGYRIPWPGHTSLPPQERCNCQCSIVMEFGIPEDEAQRLIAEHEARLAEMREPEPEKPIEEDFVFPLEQRGDDREIGTVVGRIEVPEAIQMQGELISDVAAMNDNLIDALEDYTGGGFEDLNLSLRRGEEIFAEQAETTKQLDMITSQSLGETTTVYRGMGSRSGPEFLENAERILNEGGTIRDDGFISTTLNPRVAGKFARQKPVMLQIRTKKGAYLESVTANKGEHEVLLPRATEFRVLGIDKKVQELSTGKEFTVVRVEVI